MIRKHLIGGGAPGEADFRWRGVEVTRLEGFSDAVFAFTVTLLVVSLEVPKTFPQLIEVLHRFLPFSACAGSRNVEMSRAVCRRASER
jgi:hypothetical protein